MGRNRPVRWLLIGAIALLGVVAVACAGVSQQDYDAVKAQLSEAQTQVTSLQGQLAGATSSTREPKRLEAKIDLVMGDMFFATAEGVKGGTFRLPAGKTVGIHIVNKGAIEHEVLFGQKVKLVEGLPDGYEVNLFEKVAADVFVYPSGKKVEVGGVVEFEEIEAEAGGEAWIRATFPAEARGTWELACFIPDHYEAGMKATLIIE